ncbi:hypothetical protein EHS16_03115 [Streptococcus anginosus]|nr:hypothetical protein EHS16_03115 [Streptococcus anginosus]
MGRITLSVIFGFREAFRIEYIVFDVAYISLFYNGIFGRSALIKFMAVTYCVYGVMKMLSVYGVFFIACDFKDVVWSVGEVVRAAAAADVSDEGVVEDDVLPGDVSVTKKVRVIS